MVGSGRIFANDLVLPGTRVQVVDGGQLDGELATVASNGCTDIDAGRNDYDDGAGWIWIHFDRTGSMAKKPGDRFGEKLADRWILKTSLRRYDDDDDDQGFSFFTDDGKKARQFYVCSADAHHDLYILCADGSIPRFESDRSVLRVITEGEWFAMEDGPDTDEKKS